MENPKYLEWRNPIFVNQNGISKDNCIDYISEAEHIWDANSSNAVYNFQIRQLDIKTSLEDYLKKTPGTQFNLKHYHEDLFVIQKDNREDENIKYPLNVCYISESNVYASPSCADIIRMRSFHSMFKLDHAFQSIDDEVHFHPSRGYSFKKADEISNQGNEI
eukprot:NODE_94_length_21525_cov_0.751003.p15 type:complete len:162 gc:universal NODE_94_length_21525_cov_0.751003:7902-8387(+)